MRNEGSFLRDRKGTGSAIIGLAAIFMGIMLFALVFDVGYLFVKREVIKQALDFSNMAVYREIDEAKLADGELYINEAPAQDTFLVFLQDNLKLDSSLNPLPGSVVTGQVQVVDFRIYNPGDLPTVDPLGTPINEVAVHSHIIAPVRPVFSGMFTTVDLPVAITTDIPNGWPW
ncbi:MAG: hypothetical protein H0Z39_10805 [Peptococcaceae bacterium]|nr:hypothetical protein [Peptococcaceae bacterium]